jgi:hypothetical protein
MDPPARTRPVSVTPTRLVTAKQISEPALKRWHIWRQISIEVGGRRFLGAWNLQGGLSRVSANADSGSSPCYLEQHLAPCEFGLRRGLRPLQKPARREIVAAARNDHAESSLISYNVPNRRAVTTVR